MILKGAEMTDRPVEASPQIYARIGGALALWLLVVGVNAPKWKERAGAAGERQ